MIRLFDIIFSILGLIFLSPIIFLLIILGFMDSGYPFFSQKRVGKNKAPFFLLKFRSMKLNTLSVATHLSSKDSITKYGSFLRKSKLDELPQLWNVFKGDMTLVGPRPNVKSETDIYTNAEKELLSANPGITDFASIVFSDEGEILSGKANPDIAYNQLIRPGKSALGLFYIKNAKIHIDIIILMITILSIISRSSALKINASVLKNLNAPPDLVSTAERKKKLFPKPPPGSNKIVTSRKL